MPTSNQTKHVEDFIRKTSDQPARLAKLVAITSGKGGVGKTNFILNLAIALSIRGKKVLLIDADMNLSNIDVLLGLYPKYSLADLLNETISIDDLLVDGPRGIKILPAASGSYEVMQNQTHYQKALIQVYQQLRRDYDFIFIDTGAGISDYTVDFVVSAEKVVIITTPEPTAITDAYAMIKILYYRLRSPDLSLVINMCQSDTEGKNIYNKISMIVKQFLNKNVGYLGHILADPQISEAVRSQSAIMVKNPRARAALGIQNIALNLLKE